MRIAALHREGDRRVWTGEQRVTVGRGRPLAHRARPALHRDWGLGPPQFNGGPALAAPAPPSPPYWGLLRKWMGEGDLEGTQPGFPSGATLRRQLASAGRRAGRRRVRAEGLGDTRAAAGAGRGCRPCSAPRPQVGAAVWSRGLMAAGRRGLNAEGCRGARVGARPRGSSFSSEVGASTWSPLAHSVPQSSR